MSTTIMATYGHLTIPTPIVLDYQHGTLCAYFASTGKTHYLNRQMDKPEARELYKDIRSMVKTEDFPFHDEHGNYQWHQERPGSRHTL